MWGKVPARGVGRGLGTVRPRGCGRAACPVAAAAGSIITPGIAAQAAPGLVPDLLSFTKAPVLGSMHDRVLHGKDASVAFT